MDREFTQISRAGGEAHFELEFDYFTRLDCLRLELRTDEVSPELDPNAASRRSWAIYTTDTRRRHFFHFLQPARKVANVLTPREIASTRLCGISSGGTDTPCAETGAVVLFELWPLALRGWHAQFLSFAHVIRRDEGGT
jgi:hypothetical protein